MRFGQCGDSLLLLFAHALLSDEPLLASGDNNRFPAQGIVKRGESLGAGKAAVLGSVWRWHLVVQHRIGMWWR